MLPVSSNIACLKDFRKFINEIRISIYFWVLLQLGFPVNLGLCVGVNPFTCGPLSWLYVTARRHTELHIYGNNFLSKKSHQKVAYFSVAFASLE